MNFTEAKKHRDEYLFLVGSQFHLKKFPCEVEHLIIAPVNGDDLDFMRIVSMSLAGIIANEKALKRYNLMPQDLSVYILGVKNNVRFHLPLDEYLIDTRQKVSDRI